MTVEPHVTELLPAYALDCLDDEELVQVAEHVAVCAECRAELRAYQAVTDQLALAVPETVPPADLKYRLVERIRPSRAGKVSRPRNLWWQQLVGVMQRSAPAWGLAGLVLIVALALSNVWLWQQLDRIRAVPETQAMRTIALTGTQAAPQATGMLVISADGEHGTLIVDGLPPLDPAQQYQLWLIQDGQRTSGGVFSVNHEGYGSLWVLSPQPLEGYSAFGITIEPAGGSPGPTGDKVLGSTL